MIRKQLREVPLGNQHLRNFDATHDLTQGIDHPQPPASTTKKHHKESLVIPLATLSKKWLFSQLKHPFQTPNIASSIQYIVEIRK